MGVCSIFHKVKGSGFIESKNRGKKKKHNLFICYFEEKGGGGMAINEVKSIVV